MRSTSMYLKAVALAAVLVPAVSQSAILAPGAFVPAVSQPDPIGGITIASLVAPFASSSFSGQVTSTVISGDASNPFGGLTFTYQFYLDATSPQAASQFTVSSFAGFLVDASFRGGGALPVQDPSFFSRSSDGQVVRFQFFGAPGADVGPGESTPLLVVQTSAHVWAQTEAGLINGSVHAVPSFAPLVVPEPSALALVLLGGALVALRRKA